MLISLDEVKWAIPLKKKTYRKIKQPHLPISKKTELRVEKKHLLVFFVTNFKSWHQLFSWALNKNYFLKYQYLVL